jgi:hypothetical protein
MRRCDSITEALNAKRKTDEADFSDHQQIETVERMLDRENHKQGLGFVMMGIVLDRKSYRNIFGMITTVITTVGPVRYKFSRTLLSDKPHKPHRDCTKYFLVAL